MVRSQSVNEWENNNKWSDEHEHWTWTNKRGIRTNYNKNNSNNNTKNKKKLHYNSISMIKLVFWIILGVELRISHSISFHATLSPFFVLSSVTTTTTAATTTGAAIGDSKCAWISFPTSNYTETVHSSTYKYTCNAQAQPNICCIKCIQCSPVYEPKSRRKREQQEEEEVKRKAKEGREKKTYNKKF